MTARRAVVEISGELQDIPDGDNLIAHLYLPGLAGGQAANGGTAASEELELRGTSDANLGLIRLQSPVVFDNIDAALALEQHAITYAPTQTITAAFIGGAFDASPTISFSFSTFIWEGLRAAPTITSLTSPAFAAFTEFQALPVLTAGPSAGDNILNPIVLNAGPAMVNTTGAARTVTAPVGFSWVPQLRTAGGPAGSTITATSTTGLLNRPAWNTAAGTTINFGVIRAVHAQTPTVAFFGSSAGTELMTAYYALDVESLAFSGNVPKIAVRSAIPAASAAYFLQNNGGAQSYLGTGSLAWGTSAPGDIVLSRLVANILTFADGDSLRITTGLLYMGPSGGSNLQSTVSGELAVSTTHLGFGTGAPAGANWAYAFSATARTISLGGDFSNCLNTTGGTHTINAGINFWQWRINAPSGSIGTGSVSDGGAVIIQGNVNVGTNRYGLLILSSPSGGTLNYCARFQGTAGVRIDGLIEHTGTLVGLYSATPVVQAADPVALTDSSGGTADNTVQAVSGSGDDATINDNFADLTAKYNALRAMLSAAAGGIGVAA